MVYVRLVSVELKLTLTYIMEVTATPVQFLLGVGTSTSASPVHDSSTIKWPKCTKTYNSRWETDPLLKTWISRHPDDIGKVVCNFCQSVIRAHKNDLLEHTRTLKHQRNFMAHATPEQYNQFVMELNELRKDAQLMSKKKVNNGGGKNSNNSSNWAGNNGHGHGRNSSSNSGSSSSALTVLNPLFHSKLDVDMDGAGGGLPPGAGGLVPGGCGDVSMDIWPSDMNNDQDSFLSADSPSDLVSVILEEQEQDQDQQQKELHPGSPQLSGNSNESFPPTLTPNHPTHSSLSSPSPSQHHHQQQQLTLSLLSSSVSSRGGGPSHRLTECVQNNSSNSSGQGQRPFTCGDVLTAMEGNYFSWTELWSLAKCALGIIESGSDGQTGLSSVGLNNGDHLSPQPPHIHIQPSSSHSRNNNSHPSHTITINTNSFPPSFQTNSRSSRITPVLSKPRTIRRGATSISIGRRKPKPKLPSTKLNLSRDHILHVSASAVNCSKGGDQDGDS